MPLIALVLTFFLSLPSVTEAQISIQTGPQPHAKTATDLVTALITKYLIDEGYVVDNSFQGYILRLSMIEAKVSTIGQVGLVGHISLINNGLRTIDKEFLKTPPCNDHLALAIQFSDLVGQSVLYIDDVIAIARSAEELAKALATWTLESINRSSRRAEIIKEGWNMGISRDQYGGSPESSTTR